MEAGGQAVGAPAAARVAVAPPPAVRVGSTAVDLVGPARSGPRDPSGAAHVRMTLRVRARAGAGPADSAQVGAAQPVVARSDPDAARAGSTARDDPPPALRRGRPASSRDRASRPTVRRAPMTVRASFAHDPRVTGPGRAGRRAPFRRVRRDHARPGHAGSRHADWSHARSSLAMRA